ncbi:receptor-like protein Cf-9 homolog [Rhododendron vialii]|uniref:receptor-like protein Cf-9 homolog n=1 Tax=Rhododendron vialii TaxID=182163 RepID=UPI00265F62F4|nr:receptor-like protein Cf-9 homolog [Rhododendron vialii]
MDPQPPHVLIFPLPLQGPINSMLKLAELLCLSGSLHVTFLTHLMDPLSPKEYRLRGRASEVIFQQTPSDQEVKIGLQFMLYCDYTQSDLCVGFKLRKMENMKSWKKGSDCCSWAGVDCDNKTGQVIGLDLSCSWLKGTICPNSSLFLSFPCLQNLNLAHNDFFMSPISPKFTQFNELKHLNLSDTSFSGKIPIEFSFLNKLVSLDLSANDDLRLEEGGFELLIQNLSKLRDLDLGHVKMSSSVVPNSLLNCFSEELPNSIANLKSLEVLSLSTCQFHGSLPTSLWNLTQISVLELQSNNFSGPFFSWDANLTEHFILDVSNNSLTGPLPSQVIVPPKLCFLSICRNLINGTIPSWVFKLPAFKYLDLSYNLLMGHTLEFLSASLWIIDLSNNNLHGTVPNSTFELRKLTHLILSSNSFSGTIPESNRFNENLIMLELHNNSFSGTIHDSFSMRSRLKTVNLNDNGFEGPIPKSLVNCKNLEVLDLGRNKSRNRSSNMANNHFTGPLPMKYFRSFKAMMNVDLHFDDLYMQNDGLVKPYYYSATIVFKGMPLEFKRIVKTFTIIDLSRNRFQGEIPGIISGLNSIQGLKLSYNSLTGHIPKSHGDLTMLECLDLSSNKLTREIPQHLVNLEGYIPSGRQFVVFENNSYINNLALCGPPLSNSCSDSGPPEPPPSLFQQEEDSQFASGLDWEVCWGAWLYFEVNWTREWERMSERCYKEEL